MECNKEGAIRVLEIAEKRLFYRDYVGAKKMALKAEKLFPQLDNISQLLTVSEVHCSSQLMPNGLYDWYKIIQVEPTSDENLIKKQHRKLALLLHPDKNKFPGAEAAFKLVAEANSTLSDRAKRTMYDVKRKHLARLTGPQQTAQTDAAHNSSSNINRGFKWWTACPGCKTRYQCYSYVLFKTVYCINCPRSFVASPDHMSGGGGTTKDSTGVRKPDSNLNSEQVTSSSVHRRGKRLSADTSKPTADPCPNQNPNHSSQPKFSLDVNPSRGDENQTNAGTHTAGTGMPLRRSLHNKPDVKNNGTEVDVLGPAKKARVEVNGEHDGNGGTNAVNTDTNASTCVEKEVREQDEKGKEQVVPSGSARDKDSFPKTSTGAASLLEESKTRFVYPDPFCNFDKLKDVSKFAANQIWALYDDLDGMPRFYSRICNVYNESNFKIEYTWLVHDPVNKTKAVRYGAEFTVGCGNYTLGKTETTGDRFIFSHMVSSEKGKKKGELYAILPRKGEVWALFKDWCFKWGKKLDKSRKFEYEIVEVLSDFSLASGVKIVPLVKIKGFGSVFVRVRDWAPIHVPHGEIHRFSHSVPVYRLNSSERNNNLPEGSLELHTFALPTNLPSVPIESIMPQRNDREGLTNCGDPTPSNGDTSGPTLTRRCQSPQPNADAQNLSTPSNGDTSGPTLNRRCKSPQPNADAQNISTPSNGGTSGSTLNRRCKSPQPNADAQNLSNPNGDTSGPTLTRRCESAQPNADSQNLYEYPDPKFHNFDMGRACDHFQRGQMWALYSDVDTYPKYYGWIGKVEPDPFKVHISWLEACPKSKVEKLWFDANLPISCGKFKVTTENIIYDNPDYFSHMVSTSHHKRGDGYNILPEVGEIWAVYKNWSARWTLHDLKTCEYDIVQIREQREGSMVVFPMKQVSEYWSVFMPGRIYGSGSNKWEIPYIMFSHRIPAFRLTEEQGGKLRGFWELDPASVPYTFFNHDK